MVLITNTTSPILHDVYHSLKVQIGAEDWQSVEGAFIIWMTKNKNSNSIFPSLGELQVSNYQDVAKISYILHAFPETYQNYSEWLRDGLQRVAGRPALSIDGELAQFCNDSISLLGIALGASIVGEAILLKVQQWMRSFIKVENHNEATFKDVLSIVSLGIVGVTNVKNTGFFSGPTDLALAFAAKGYAFFGDLKLDEAYIECCKNSLKETVEPSVAACRLAFLDYACNYAPVISISLPTVKQLVALLEKLPSSMKRWPWEEKPRSSRSTIQKWDIQNEYHVQSLIYALLAPIFPDLEDEFYFEPIGQLNPRADIGIPSLKLIIEVKFIRSSVSFAKMIEEIAADASLYFARESVFLKKYSQLLVFLWDDSSRNQEHHVFKKGVMQLNNICNAIVVSRPGNMERHAPNSIIENVIAKRNKISTK